MRRILISRAARSLAYGALAVVLAEALARRGFSPIGIGAAITVALLTGALTSALTGRLGRKFCSRAPVGGGGCVRGPGCGAAGRRRARDRLRVPSRRREPRRPGRRAVRRDRAGRSRRRLR